MNSCRVATTQSGIVDVKKVNKPKTYRDLGKFDVTEVQNTVLRLSDRLWKIENQRKENNFSVFHHTEHIIFRFPPGNQNPLNYYSNPIWRIWEPMLLPLMDEITAPYDHKECQYSKVMLARLLAGQHIDRHVDGAGSNLLTHKMHVPIITNPNVLFTVEDDTRHLKFAHAYEVNNIVRHAASNNSDQHRVHLIFEHFDASQRHSS